MPTTARKQVILDLIDDVWSHGNLDALPNYWTDDCVNHADPGGAVGLGPLRAYHEGFQAGFTEFSDVHIEVLRQVEEGDTVVTQMRMSATHSGLGRDVTLDTIRIDRLRDLRIAEHRSVADMAGLMGQLR